MIYPKWNKKSKQELASLINHLDRYNIYINPALIALYPFKSDRTITLPSGDIFDLQYNRYDRMGECRICLSSGYQEPTYYIFTTNTDNGTITEYKMAKGIDFADKDDDRYLPTQEDYTMFCLEHSVQNAPELITEKVLVNSMCDIVESIGIDKQIVDSWRI